MSKHQVILTNKSIAVVYFVQTLLGTIIPKDDMDLIDGFRLIFYGEPAELPRLRAIASSLRPIYHTLPAAYKRKFRGKE